MKQMRGPVLIEMLQAVFSVQYIPVLGTYIQKDAIQEVKFQLEDVIFWEDMQICAEKGQPRPQVTWRRKYISLNSTDKS